MILRLAVLILLAVMPYTAVAVDNDSVWVKVPVAAIDSVWVRVPVSDRTHDPVECDTPVAADASAGAPALQSVGIAGRRQAWNRKHTDDPSRVVFSWGAEAGSSIDMSENDMSSVDFNATFGLRYRWISFAGVGAGANIMVSNSCRTYPVFAVFRTDFSGCVRFLFLDLRGGAALNYLSSNVSQTDAYGAAAVGFVLSTGKTFRSYITAGYTYVGRRDVITGDVTTAYRPLSMVSIRLGISF